MVNAALAKAANATPIAPITPLDAAERSPNVLTFGAAVGISCGKEKAILALSHPTPHIVGDLLRRAAPDRKSQMGSRPDATAFSFVASDTPVGSRPDATLGSAQLARSRERLAAAATASSISGWRPFSPIRTWSAA